MKLSMITLAMLCGTLFAAENVKFTTKPAQKALDQKEISSITVLPEGLKKDKFYRLTMQLNLKKSDKLVATLIRGTKKTWERMGCKPEGWSQYTQYFAPGEAWQMSLSCRSKGYTMQVKDIKLEELDENDLTVNLLPPLKDAGWYSGWSENEPKLEFVKSEDSPFGAEVFSSEINKGTGYPATIAIPVVPGRTLNLTVWSKGEPVEGWWVSIMGVGMQTLAVKKEWNKQVLKYKVKADAVPSVGFIIFWKPKNQKPLKCSFAKVEVCYEK